MLRYPNDFTWSSSEDVPDFANIEKLLVLEQEPSLFANEATPQTDEMYRSAETWID